MCVFFGSDCGLRDQLSVLVFELKLTTREQKLQLKFIGPGIRIYLVKKMSLISFILAACVARSDMALW